MTLSDLVLKVSQHISVPKTVECSAAVFSFWQSEKAQVIVNAPHPPQQGENGQKYDWWTMIQLLAWLSVPENMKSGHLIRAQRSYRAIFHFGNRRPVCSDMAGCATSPGPHIRPYSSLVLAGAGDNNSCGEIIDLIIMPAPNTEPLGLGSHHERLSSHIYDRKRFRKIA